MPSAAVASAAILYLPLGRCPLANLAQEEVDLYKSARGASLGRFVFSLGGYGFGNTAPHLRLSLRGARPEAFSWLPRARTDSKAMRVSGGYVRQSWRGESW